jgi:ribosomal protein S18 acetylase RimI-like enzyme
MFKLKVNNYQVTEMKEDDLSGASYLFSNLFGVEEKPIELAKKSYDNIRNNRDYVSLVVRDSLDPNRIVGYGLGVVNNFYLDTGKPMMVIWGLCIDNSVQKKGLGRMLMQAFETKAVELGCEAIWLFSGKHKTNSHKLYSSLGYEDAKKGFIKNLI